ncbi:MAG: DNA photolyase family protein [Luteimonas sp.]|nr:DNA photolyase family protein [Luteimonas sp.]
MPNALIWFRNDLRLADNPALQAALDEGYAPVCVYVHAPGEERDWAPGAASNAWRHRSLARLDADLRERGSCLRLFRGPSLQTLQTLIAACDARAVFWNRRYEPAIERRDTRIKQVLRGEGVRAESFNGALLFEPWQLQTKQGGPYKVFTPFWRSALADWRLAELRDVPATLAAVVEGPGGVDLDTLRLAPALGWDASFWDRWIPGEAGAHETLEVFIDGALRGYRDGRDRPDQAGTSRLSPHLHFGEIAPWRVAKQLEAARNAANAADVDACVRELGWREFAHHLMHYFPESTERNLNPRFEHFEWAPRRESQLQAWQSGHTGVPIVDAGMRELWHTGWMHNRVRMIVASYLCKHMRQHWLAGARWFWDTLVDADLASNSLGWQWVAGTGADAAPYFRVFNPVTQARKFDPDGRYIARWVPELATLDIPARFAPWTEPERSTRDAPGYPAKPVVDLACGREEALEAYRKTR